MTQSYKIEHFMVCGLAVAAVKALDDRVLQTWAADESQKCMVRNGGLISAIEGDSRVRPMSKPAFDSHCARRNIETGIPVAAIAHTLMLNGLPMEPANDPRGPTGSFRGRGLVMG